MMLETQHLPTCESKLQTEDLEVADKLTNYWYGVNKKKQSEQKNAESGVVILLNGGKKKKKTKIYCVNSGSEY